MNWIARREWIKVEHEFTQTRKYCHDIRYEGRECMSWFVDDPCRFLDTVSSWIIIICITNQLYWIHIHKSSHFCRLYEYIPVSTKNESVRQPRAKSDNIEFSKKKCVYIEWRKLQDKIKRSLWFSRSKKNIVAVRLLGFPHSSNWQNLLTPNREYYEQPKCHSWNNFWIFLNKLFQMWLIDIPSWKAIYE